MFEILIVAAFIYLLIKAVGLTLKVTWGLAKIVAGILMALALPLLVVCLLFVGGAVLLVPVVMLGIAAGMLRFSLNA